MLKIEELETWEDFENKMRPLNKSMVEDQFEKIPGNFVFDPYLFRGQPDANMGLDTTLERALGKNQEVNYYLALIKTILPEINTFTEKKWDVFAQQGDGHNVPEIIDPQLPYKSDDFPIGYMTYLRHYGFPSPLLDWSLSPYVAAYFAFRNMASNAEKVAVFSYKQSYNNTDRGPRKKPIITPLLSITDIQGNKRHYLQQSVYTVCINLEEGVPYFAHHESAYSQVNEAEKFEDYDKGEYLTKYTLPAREREKALLSLEQYNINSFSLMGSEESLLETLFIRHAAPYKGWRSMYPNLPNPYHF